MHIFKTLITTLALSTMATSVNARDSFSLGINIGGYGYAPPPVVHYYPAPATVYYGAPTVYYGAPIVRYAPIISYQHYSNGYYSNHNRGRGWDNDYRGRGHASGWGHRRHHDRD